MSFMESRFEGRNGVDYGVAEASAVQQQAALLRASTGLTYWDQSLVGSTGNAKLGWHKWRKGAFQTTVHGTGKA